MERDIDLIIRKVREAVPRVEVQQLPVVHPGVDDDGLWYFKLPHTNKDIQIESSLGKCPFVVEHYDMKRTSDAWQANSVDEATSMIVGYLRVLEAAAG